jgi:C-terminal processing protease CtpA/Prc
MWTREVVVSRDLRAWFGPGGERGLLVTTVEKDETAARAGMRIGDVITEIDGQPTAPYLWSNAALLITNGEGGTATLTVARK